MAHGSAPTSSPPVRAHDVRPSVAVEVGCARRARVLACPRSRPRHPASQASGASASRCTQRGGKAACTSCSNSRVKRARSSGLGYAPEHRASLLGECDRGLEELLHLERGPDLDPDERGLVAGVGEVVRDAGRDDDDVAGLGDDPLAPHPEAHRAADHLEALLLVWVDVQAAGYAAALLGARGRSRQARRRSPRRLRGR